LTIEHFVVVTPDRHVVPTDMVPLPEDLSQRLLPELNRRPWRPWRP
jgi:hypothetical protein